MTDRIMETINIDSNTFQASKIQTSHANIMLIQAKQGFLGCGYFDIGTSNKLSEPVAIVTGVKSYDDMLGAKVIKVSEAAKDLGIEIGDSGKEALIKLNQ
jgi:uncharacterized protein YunC (DUF1805 family)